jgi:N-acetylglucosaminyldiphosphoundecaprenol N-acetyl-beta-D-mannosaminyltransferase
MEMTAGAPLRPDVSFLGVDFAPIGLGEAIEHIVDAGEAVRFSYVVTPNVDHIVMLHEAGDESWRSAYREAVTAAALRLNDSRILARLAKLSGLRLPVTPGSDLTRELVARAAAGSLTRRWLLVGGSKGEAAWLARRLPGHDVSHYEPPMGVRDDAAAQAAIAERVAAAQADYVLFAIGAPQSEIVAHQIAREGRARGVGLCIGASVEFLSGAKRRAPRAIQRMGLEWLHRLLSEPRRLWRRYLLRGPRVFIIWWRTRRG